jgi:hypothetical protein
MEGRLPAVSAGHSEGGEEVNPYMRHYTNLCCGAYRREADEMLQARRESHGWREYWPELVLWLSLCAVAWALAILWAIMGGRIDG